MPLDGWARDIMPGKSRGESSWPDAGHPPDEQHQIAVSSSVRFNSISMELGSLCHSVDALSCAIDQYSQTAVPTTDEDGGEACAGMVAECMRQILHQHEVLRVSGMLWAPAQPCCSAIRHGCERS